MMNPLTLELAQQAGLKKDHGSDREYMGDFDWRAFAELIVRECSQMVHNSHPDDLPFVSGKMLVHFGVE
jgi:hypothetical protein